MNYEDLIEFRDNVATPRMLQLFEKTEIPENTCYIDNLEINFYDGRSWGSDSRIIAKGYLFTNGEVKEFSYDEYDVEINDFIDAHKNCIYMSGGNLKIFDELEEMELSTFIRNINRCEALFPGLKNLKDMNIEFVSAIYSKMEYLFALQKQEKQNPIEEIISDAKEKYESQSFNDFVINQNKEK